MGAKSCPNIYNFINVWSSKMFLNDFERKFKFSAYSPFPKTHVNCVNQTLTNNVN